MAVREIERYPEDEGCEFEDRCLECERPYTQCPAHTDRVFMDRRTAILSAIIRSLARIYRKPVREIVRILGISESTIRRALRKIY